MSYSCFLGGPFVHWKHVGAQCFSGDKRGTFTHRLWGDSFSFGRCFSNGWLLRISTAIRVLLISCPSPFPALELFSSHCLLLKQVLLLSHFADQEREAQSGWVTCPRSTDNKCSWPLRNVKRTRQCQARFLKNMYINIYVVMRALNMWSPSYQVFSA